MRMNRKPANNKHAVELVVSVYQPLLLPATRIFLRSRMARSSREVCVDAAN